MKKTVKISAIMLVMGSFSLGFLVAVSASGRTWGVGLLAIPLSITIFLIAALDRPVTKIISVSQKPLLIQRESMQE